MSTADSDESFLPALIQFSEMETLCPISGLFTEGAPSIPSHAGENDQDEHRRLAVFSNVEYLTSFPRSLLKVSLKNVTEVLTTAKQARKEAAESRGGSNLQEHRKKQVRSQQNNQVKSTLCSDANIQGVQKPFGVMK